MILSFADQGTQDIFECKASKHARKVLDVHLHGLAKRKLDLIDFSLDLKDLRTPPGNRLESLSGNLVGFYSIRINDKWRIVFSWEKSGPGNVRICDYH